MQKGYKREGKGMAVLRCFIGLFIIIVVVLLASFMMNLDYTDKLDPSASMRPYVEASPTPAAAPSASANPAAALPADEPSAMPSVTPTVEPTSTPVPTPTPSPTPEPTAIPSTSFSAVRTDLNCPELSTKTAKLGITYSYVSSANDNSVIHLKGYGYIDDAKFDTSTARLFLVLNRESDNRKAFVQVAMKDGASGVEHEGALCANASATDFEAVIDVSSFPQDIYTLGMVIGYSYNGQSGYDYFEFPEGTSLTVLNGKIISDVPVTEAE